MQTLKRSNGLTIAIALAGILGCADDPHYSKVPTASLPTAPIAVDAIHLLDVDGQAFDFASISKNAASVFIFTSTDCPISNRYAPVIRELYESVHPRGVEIYLVYADKRKQPDAIRAHLKEYELPCPAVRDPEHSLVAATGAHVTPEAVVVAADRRMTYRGRIDDRNADFGQARTAAAKNDLADAIEATLAGRPVAEPVTKAVGCYIADLK